MPTLFDIDQQIADREYDRLVSFYSHKESKSNGTGIENVLQFFLDNQEKVWWFSWELIGKTTSNGGWLSHRAPARASDLAIYHPDLVETRKIGRYSVYRLRTENIDTVKEFLK